MFFPLSSTEHKLFRRYLQQLRWPKPLLQILLLASCLTLFEDLPHLRKLAARGIDRLVKLNMVSNHQTMWLLEDSLIYMVRA